MSRLIDDAKSCEMSWQTFTIRLRDASQLKIPIDFTKISFSPNGMVRCDTTELHNIDEKLAKCRYEINDKHKDKKIRSSDSVSSSSSSSLREQSSSSLVSEEYNEEKKDALSFVPVPRREEIKQPLLMSSSSSLSSESSDSINAMHLSDSKTCSFSDSINAMHLSDSTEHHHHHHHHHHSSSSRERSENKEHPHHKRKASSEREPSETLGHVLLSEEQRPRNLHGGLFHYYFEVKCNFCNRVNVLMRKIIVSIDGGYVNRSPNAKIGYVCMDCLREKTNEIPIPPCIRCGNTSLLRYHFNSNNKWFEWERWCVKCICEMHQIHTS